MVSATPSETGHDRGSGVGGIDAGSASRVEPLEINELHVIAPSRDRVAIFVEEEEHVIPCSLRCGPPHDLPVEHAQLLRLRQQGLRLIG